MSTIGDYSATAGSNTSAPPNGAPEGMAPSSVNDIFRDMMARLRSFWDSMLGSAHIWCSTAGGTADALTLTPTPAMSAYAAGQTFRFIAASANTSTTPTVAVSGLATKTIQRQAGALAAGDIVAGATCQITYDGSYFQLTSVSGNEVRKSTVGNFSAQQYNGTQTLTDGATISWDLDTQPVAKVTLGGNRTLANPTNMKDGGFYLLRVIQDGTGSRTLTLGSAYKKADGAALTLTTTAAAVDILFFHSDGSNMFLVPAYAFS